MIVEYIRYTVEDADRGAALVEAYDNARSSLEASPDCISYELTVCEEDPSSYVLRIVWTSTDAHLNGFRKSREFSQFFQAVAPFVKEIAEMRHYRVILSGVGRAARDESRE